VDQLAGITRKSTVCAMVERLVGAGPPGRIMTMAGGTYASVPDVTHVFPGADLRARRDHRVGPWLG
jgi:hypothetical protein